MEVSPEYFIQLSHRVNTLHREKEKFIESPGEKDRKVIESPSGKGQGNIVNLGQKTESISSYYSQAQVKRKGIRPEKPVI